MGLDFDQAIPQLDTLAHDISGSIANHQVTVDSLLNSAALLTESEICLLYTSPSPRDS